MSFNRNNKKDALSPHDPAEIELHIISLGLVPVGELIPLDERARKWTAEHGPITVYGQPENGD